MCSKCDMCSRARVICAQSVICVQGCAQGRGLYVLKV
jgi:hypothetical protein